MRYTEIIHTFHPTDLEVLAESHAEEFHTARDLAERSARKHVADWLRHVAEHIEEFDIFDCDVPESTPGQKALAVALPTRGVAFAFTLKAKV